MKGNLPIPLSFACVNGEWQRAYSCVRGSHNHWRMGYHVDVERKGTLIENTDIRTFFTYETLLPFLAEHLPNHHMLRP